MSKVVFGTYVGLSALTVVAHTLGMIDLDIIFLIHSSILAIIWFMFGDNFLVNAAGLFMYISSFGLIYFFLHKKFKPLNE